MRADGRRAERARDRTRDDECAIEVLRGSAQRVHLRAQGCERIVRLAFELAVAEGRRSVHCATKANIMKLSDGLFLDCARKVGEAHPEHVAARDRGDRQQHDGAHVGLGQIVEAVLRTLENADAELSADLVDNGIMLAGGGAMLRGIGKVIEERTGLSVRIAEDPLTCVARGTAIYLENLEEWKATMDTDVDEG